MTRSVARASSKREASKRLALAVASASLLILALLVARERAGPSRPAKVSVGRAGAATSAPSVPHRWRPDRWVFCKRKSCRESHTCVHPASATDRQVCAPVLKLEPNNPGLSALAKAQAHRRSGALYVVPTGHFVQKRTGPASSGGLWFVEWFGLSMRITRGPLGRKPSLCDRGKPLRPRRGSAFVQPDADGRRPPPPRPVDFTAVCHLRAGTEYAVILRLVAAAPERHFRLLGARRLAAGLPADRSAIAGHYRRPLSVWRQGQRYPARDCSAAFRGQAFGYHCCNSGTLPMLEVAPRVLRPGAGGEVTERGCFTRQPPPGRLSLMELDDALAEALRRTRRYQLAGPCAVLLDATGRPTLTLGKTQQNCEPTEACEAPATTCTSALENALLTAARGAAPRR